MARPRVLITGFGPFPGVADNPSGWLAEALLAKGISLPCDLHGHVLPTEWEAVAALAPHLHETLQPHVMIHFGVSPNAKGLRIEGSARNRNASRPDAKGALPTKQHISPGGAARLDTKLPASAIAAALRARGHAAVASRACGSYLCNFLYYRSLEWARPQARDALFVHVPHVTTQGGHLSERDLLDAAEATVHAVVGVAARQRTIDTVAVEEARP
jgi:pyroglutamyl-peptidase